jgi:hypothetical protein
VRSCGAAFRPQCADCSDSLEREKADRLPIPEVARSSVATSHPRPAQRDVAEVISRAERNGC